MSRRIRTDMTDKEASLAMWSWIMWCIIHDHDIRCTVRHKKAQWLDRHKQKFSWVNTAGFVAAMTVAVNVL